MESTANIRGSDYLLPVSQGRKMEQAGEDTGHVVRQEADLHFSGNELLAE